MPVVVQQSVTQALRLLGLPPIIGRDTRMLVLGSFPGAASLARQQYYAHPQNQFWRILQALWPDQPGALQADNYPQRCDWLLARGLGLWDVYASCQRVGSLDSAIGHALLNDFAGLAQGCPRLKLIAHNGGESFRHAPRVAASLGSQVAGPGRPTPPIAVLKLPSTSPANASWSFERKLQAWRAAAHDAGLL